MSDEFSGLVLRGDLIPEIVYHYNKAVESWAKYFAALGDAKKHLDDARASLHNACGGSPQYPSDMCAEVKAFHAATTIHDTEKLVRVAGRVCDAATWRSIVDRTDISLYMDAVAREELHDQMVYVPEEGEYKAYSGTMVKAGETVSLPPITEESIEDVLEGFRMQAGEIWRRGIATAFSRLSKAFKSHDGFKIGSRIILRHAFNDYGGWAISYGPHAGASTRDALRDVERAFVILDGQKPSPDYAGIIGQIDRERKEMKGEWGGLSAFASEHDGDYFKVRIFQNGNAHLWFTRKDLVEKVNQLLAKHYGPVLGAGKDYGTEESTSGAERGHARNYGEFFSPPDVVCSVLRRAGLYSRDPMLILEPSAGEGAISKPVAGDLSGIPKALQRKRDLEWMTEQRAHIVDVVEVQSRNAKKLESSGLYRKVYNRDFLRMEPNPVYDRILMNPPFDRGRDIDHVLHAHKFLKGDDADAYIAVTSVMSASAAYGHGPRQVRFQKFVEEHGGHFEDLKPRSFAVVGTNVNTVVCHLPKRRRRAYR
jgi:hypothetical protein